MKELSREQVMHVAALARLELTEEELKKYAVQLFDILHDIEKIKQISVGEDTDILIAPTFHNNCYREDLVTEELTHEDINKNANKVYGDYIVVPKVLHD